MKKEMQRAMVVVGRPVYSGVLKPWSFASGQPSRRHFLDGGPSSRLGVVGSDFGSSMFGKEMALCFWMCTTSSLCRERVQLFGSFLGDVENCGRPPCLRSMLQLLVHKIADEVLVCSDAGLQALDFLYAWLSIFGTIRMSLIFGVSIVSDDRQAISLDVKLP